MSGESFVKVPDALLFDAELPSGVLKAYLMLARCARTFSTDTFDMTVDQLATLLGYSSRRQGDRVLAALVDRGLVAVEGNRGRARANQITVLDPYGCVFSGLHLKRAATEMSQQAATEMSQPAATKMSQPYREEREDRGGQRLRGEPLPSPVDNGGAPRPPRPPAERVCSRYGHEHARLLPTGQCSHCHVEALEATGPPF